MVEAGQVKRRFIARDIFAFLPRGSLPAVLSRGANAGIAFLSTLVLARVLGPEPYGVYALAVTTLGLLALAAQLGLDALTPRNLGIYVHDKDWPHAFSFLRWTTRVVVVASAIAYGAATLVLLWNPMTWSADQILASRLILLGLPFVALLRLSRARLQAFDKTALGIFYELPLWNTLLLLSGLAAAFIPAFRTSTAMAALHACTFVVAWLGAHFAVQRQLPARPDHLEPTKGAWMRSGAFFTALAGLGFLLQQGDILLVGTLLSPEQTGHFSVAVRSAGLTLIVLGPLQQVVAPRIAKAWSRGDKDETQRLARRCAQLSLLAGIPMVLFFWILGPYFLRLFGPQYDDALWALRWLSLAQVLFVAAGPGGMVLQMIHEERASLFVSLTVVALGLPLTAWMTLQYGIAGAGLAKVLTLFAAGSGAYLTLRLRKGLDILPWRIA